MWRDSLPEERPAIFIGIGHLRLSRRGAGVGRAGSVGGSVGFVIFVVGDEDGEGLCFCFNVRGCLRLLGISTGEVRTRCPSVVRALRGLNCLGGLCGCGLLVIQLSRWQEVVLTRAVISTGAFALRVGACWVESSQRKACAEKNGEERLGKHGCGGQNAVDVF